VRILPAGVATLKKACIGVPPDMITQVWPVLCDIPRMVCVYCQRPSKASHCINTHEINVPTSIISGSFNSRL